MPCRLENIARKKEKSLVTSIFFLFSQCFPCGSVVKCLARNQGAWVRAALDPLVFFRGSVLGQDTSEPSLALVRPRKDMNNVIYRRDMTESGVKHHSIVYILPNFCGISRRQCHYEFNTVF